MPFWTEEMEAGVWELKEKAGISQVVKQKKTRGK